MLIKKWRQPQSVFPFGGCTFGADAVVATVRHRRVRITNTCDLAALLDLFSAKGARSELFRVHISWSGRVVALIQTFQDKIPVGWDEVFVQWRSRSSWNRYVYHQKSHIRFPGR